MLRNVCLWCNREGEFSYSSKFICFQDRIAELNTGRTQEHWEIGNGSSHENHCECVRYESC
jgi:hypothetical protein